MSGVACGAPALEITRISIGESQILIEFDRPVAPLGRMEREAEELPITIEPRVNCHWRWVSTRTLGCNLDQQDYLKPAHEYAITVEPGIQAMDGTTTNRTVTRRKVMELPDVSSARILTWTSPGVPVLRIGFNQPVTRRSVAASIHFKVSGTRDSWYVAVEPDLDDRTEPEFPDQDARRQWLVSPQTELPLGQTAVLHARPGLVSALGPLPGAGRSNLARVDVFGEFRFAGLSCWNIRGHRVRYLPDGTTVRVRRERESQNVEREILEPVAKAQALCDTSRPVVLYFTAPVLSSEVARETRLAPGLAGNRKDYMPWSQVRDYSELDLDYGAETFHVGLPERLQAYQEYHLTTLPSQGSGATPESGIRDKFDRILEDGIDLKFMTDHRDPEYQLLYRSAVLEAGVESEYPLYVTNLDEVRLDYWRLGPDGASESLSRLIKPPPAEDVSFALPMGVRRMIGAGSGAVLGDIRSTPPSRRQYWEQWPYFAQVTPYQVHVKAGHYNTLVWVTHLRTGKPVRGAQVRILRGSFSDLFQGTSEPAPGAVSVHTDRRGVAMLPGTVTLSPELDEFQRCGSRYRSSDCRSLFVLVTGGEGMALLPLERDFRARDASRWQERTLQRGRYGHVRAWGTTAQVVYRAGDTIQYKVYVRDQNVRTLVAPEFARYALRVEDPGGKTVHRAENLVLNEFGAMHGEFDVPKTAVMGWYQFVLEDDSAPMKWWPMRALVTDFTPEPFRVSSQMSGDLFGPGDSVTVDTAASLHSGGAYTQAQTRVTLDLRQMWFRSTHPEASTFRFDTALGSDFQVRVHQELSDLDDAGSHSAQVVLEESKIVYGQIRAESAVRDDRGKYVTARSYADYRAVSRLVGLRRDDWLFRQGEPATVRYLVVNEHGEPVGDTGVELRIQRQERKLARVRGAGNAYLPRFSDEWVAAGECSGTPLGKPLVCSFTPSRAGTYRITAAVEDSRGRLQQTSMDLRVTGEGHVVGWEQPGHGMNLVSEAAEYEVGDTARYLVKNPFPGALALVSVERYGVLDQWQVRLKGSTPVIKVPVKPDYVPGAYVSVVVVSPTVEATPQETHQELDSVDLGKPAFRIGYAVLPVVDPYKRIDVSVETDRAIYKPRERVSVKLRGKPRRGRRGPLEFSVVVLDEAVFELVQQGADYFDPYKGFYRLEPLDVANYSILMRLVGHQKFAQKGDEPRFGTELSEVLVASAAGGLGTFSASAFSSPPLLDAVAAGDGEVGPVDIRTLFKYVAHWQPSLVADRRGEARFDFELPENLTGWRVLAMAVTPGDKFGLGDTSFKSNQPTEIRPVMPNQVTEGDEFAAGFSVMNRTGETRVLDVLLEAEGDIDPDSAARLEQKLELGPYGRETVFVPLRAGRVKIARDQPQGEVRFTATARDGVDGDAVAHQLPVRSNRSFEAAAQYGSLTDESAIEAVAFPRDIYTDTGEVSVVLAPTVIGNLEGAFRYMRDYPYLCWEQRLSQALLAAQYTVLKERMGDSVEWPGSADLPGLTLKQAAGFQAPNGGMTYWSAQDNRVSPYLSAYTALGFAWLREAGYAIPEAMESKLLDYLRRMLRRDTVPSYYSRGMSSTVRAVALAALARRGQLSSGELSRYAQQVQYMSLFGKAHFLDAALRTPGGESAASETLRGIMDESVASAGKRLFNEQLDQAYSRILDTPLRSNCALLSAFSRLEGEARHGVDETMASGMARALTQSRGARMHWENTQENVFCMNALVDYARRWEAVPPEMRVSAELAGKAIGETGFKDFRDAAVTLSRPITPELAGKKTQIEISRQGKGRLYYTTRLEYSPLEAASGRVNAGIDLRREYSVQRDGEWHLLHSGDVVRRGELVRVDLFLNLPAARNFVVVDDPVPGGLEPVNRDLATASEIDAEQDDFQAAGSSYWFDFDDWIRYGGQFWSFYHRELRHDAVRFYSDYLPPGRYHLSYTAQVIASGDYQVRPTHAEEMYDIDIYGKTAPMRLKVSE